MGFKIKYKQQLRNTVAGGGGGGGSSSGATPPASPPRPQEPAPLPQRSPSPPSEHATSPRRRSPSPPVTEGKIPPRNNHCDPYDHSGQHGSRTQLYVGNISRYTREQDLEAAFGRYGRLQQVHLQQGEDYGFVTFYDPKDADAARNGLDGQEICGGHITVQFAKEHKMARQDGNSKLYVSKISAHTRKNDLKHLFIKYGRVRKVNVKESYGFVEFYDPQDADDARCKLNGHEFKGNRISVEFATGLPRGLVDSAQILCYNCGKEGHLSRDCKASDLCFRCGEKGHLIRNCRNSPKDIRRRRSHSRSQSPGHGMGQSWRYRSRSRSYSQPASPRREGNRQEAPVTATTPGAGAAPHQGNQQNASGSFRDAVPRRGDNRNTGVSRATVPGPATDDEQEDGPSQLGRGARPKIKSTRYLGPDWVSP